MGYGVDIAGVMRRVALALACALTLLALPACGGGDGAGTAVAAGAALDAGQASGAAFTQPSEVAVSASSAGGIDLSHVNEGYASASATSDSRLKFQVKCGEMAYNYDLPGDGTPIVCPVNMGDGHYLFRVMQNTDGNNYVEVDAVEADVALASELAPFLTSNVYCNYDADSKCVAKAREVTAKSANQGEAVRDICNFVAGNVTYDTAKAEELSTGTGYVPDPDSTLASGKGICFDYASLSAAMLRSMGLPAKVVTGYVTADQIYHAWIMVYVDGTWKSAQFSVDPKTWSRCDVTFASSGSNQYVGDGGAYTDKYTY